MGVLAGLIAGVVESIASVPLMATQRRLMETQLEQMPESVRPMMEAWMASGAISAIAVVTTLVIGAIFGTLGGLLGAAVLGRREQ